MTGEKLPKTVALHAGAANIFYQPSYAVCHSDPGDRNCDVTVTDVGVAAVMGHFVSVTR